MSFAEDDWGWERCVVGRDEHWYWRRKREAAKSSEVGGVGVDVIDPGLALNDEAI